ncbi:MAG: helix-turn-helix transcriptional regulator [Proteobacteria bacterium]|nr:helix-turn-helix transcriptional regulator [Pseudomonadota bacterium]
MPAKFADCEPPRNSKVRNLRGDRAREFSHPANIMSQTQWFLREWRLQRGLTLEGLAEAAGTSKSYVSQMESGSRPLNQRMLERFAIALGITPRQLVAENPRGHTPKRQVRKIGYVGAGAEAHYYAHGELDDYVDAPDDATESTVAVEVRGSSLGPVFERWLVYYDDVRAPVTPDLFGELCVIGLADDRVLVKQLKPSRTRGLFHLVSNSGEPTLFDQEILWAAKVTGMKPHT